MIHGALKASRTHVHHLSTLRPGPWSSRAERSPLKQREELYRCCSLIYKDAHFMDAGRIRPLFLPPHPRRNRYTPASDEADSIPLPRFPKEPRKLHIHRLRLPFQLRPASLGSELGNDRERVRRSRFHFASAVSERAAKAPYPWAPSSFPTRSARLRVGERRNDR